MALSCNSRQYSVGSFLYQFVNVPKIFSGDYLPGDGHKFD